MLFNSYIFILVFLPLTIAGYFLINRFANHPASKMYLTLMSFWFYAYFNIAYLPLMLFSIGVNYCLYRCLQKRKNGFLLAVGILLNIGVLFYFKYFDFFIDNINTLFGTDFILLKLVLPLGISFFTFQQVGFLIDAAKGEIKNVKVLDYALFVTFFPQLIAGPIVSHDEMLVQFEDENKRHFDFDNASRGIYRFALGLSKKVLLADVLGRGVAYGYGNISELGGFAAVLVLISYMLQLYFDFSGYCDMASGAALMMNIRLPENFDSPYKAVSVPDFWKRWHLTLTRFLTRYVYIPLGGSRKGTARTYVNMMVVFILSGIWHGAGWTFILWGTIHGGLLCIERAIGKYFSKKIKQLGTLVRAAMCAFNFVLTALLLVIFRSETMEIAGKMYEQVFCGSYNLSDMTKGFVASYQMPEFFYILKVFGFDGENQIPVIICLGIIIIGMIITFFAPNTRALTENFRPDRKRMLVTVVLMLWCIISFSQVSTFLYFNF